MSKKFALLFILFCGSLLYAQSIQNTWTTYQDNAQIAIQYKREKCNVAGNDIYAHYEFLKFTNKTNTSLSVSWDLEAYYNGVCQTCNNSEYHYNIVIPANGSIEAICGNNENLSLMIFREWINNKHVQNDLKLTRFELTNITITQ